MGTNGTTNVSVGNNAGGATSIYGSNLELGTTSSTIVMGGTSATSIHFNTALSTSALAIGSDGTSILLNPPGSGAYLTSPSSIPTSVSGNAGLGITWNEGNGSGLVNFISYGQIGSGGYSFTSVNTSQVTTNFVITPSSIDFYIYDTSGSQTHCLYITPQATGVPTTITINGICLLQNSITNPDKTIPSGHYLQQVNGNTLRLFASGIFGFRNSGNTDGNGLGRQMFRIDGTGNNSAANSFTFFDYLQNAIFIINQYDSTTLAGLVTSSYPITCPTYTATSDYRIKQDIHEISQETTVDQLNPVTYKNTITGKQDMGFIAHELQEHFPFLVSGEKDGPTNQSINYIGLIALLTKEIQELKKEMQDLKQRVLTLEKRDKKTR